MNNGAACGCGNDRYSSLSGLLADAGGSIESVNVDVLRVNAGHWVEDAERIVADAGDEGSLTASERRRLDRLLADAGQAKDRLTSYEAGRSRSRGGMGMSADGRMIPFGRGEESLSRLPGEVVALKPSERLAPSVVLAAGAVPGPDMGMGQFVRGIVTGRWPGVPGGFQASMGTGTGGTGGGYLVPSPLAGRVIDLARAHARVIEAGALTVPMTSGTMSIARVAGDPAGSWKAENAALAADSDIQFESVVLKAHSLVAIASISIELAEDGQDVAGVVDNALAQALGNQLDLAALSGTGANDQPLGIKGQTGVTLQTAVGALTNYDPFSVAVQSIAAANGEASGVIYSPLTAGKLDRLKDLQNQPLRPPPSFAGISKLVTKQASDTEAFVGQWNELILGIRTDLVIEASREASSASGNAFSSLQVKIRAYLRADVALAHPAHFVYMSGIA